MKLSTLLLFAACSVLATPVFWGHPNVQTSLDAPQLPFGQVVDVNLDDLITQNPQDQIWFTGGLVGYFANEWRAPVWTVPWVDLRLEPREVEPALFYLHNPPSVSASTAFIISDPPDPERVVIRPNYLHVDDPPRVTPRGVIVTPDPIPDPTPNSIKDPVPDPTPDPLKDPIPDPNVVNETPEPNLSAILAALLATTVGIHTRIKRRR